MEGASTKGRDDIVWALEKDGEKTFGTPSIVGSFFDESRQMKAIENVLYDVLEHGYIELDRSDIAIQRSYEFG